MLDYHRWLNFLDPDPNNKEEILALADILLEYLDVFVFARA